MLYRLSYERKMIAEQNRSTILPHLLQKSKSPSEKIASRAKKALPEMHEVEVSLIWSEESYQKPGVRRFVKDLIHFFKDGNNELR